MSPERGSHVLVDTSVMIGAENEPDVGSLPASAFVSVVTVAELRLGVLMAPSLQARARRLATLRLAESLEPLAIDDRIAEAWATLAAWLRTEGRKVPVNDCWIAATAIARRMPVATRDGDYDHMPGVSVIRL
jgi:predicted nucleic acid-binding protein